MHWPTVISLLVLPSTGTAGASPAGQAVLEVRSPVVVVAPPPRLSWSSPVESGVVTSIEKTFITVQGLRVWVKKASRIDDVFVGRTSLIEYSGQDLEILGSFTPMNGVKVTRDSQGFTVLHADGTSTTVLKCEQPHRKYWLSDSLRAGYSGTGGRGRLHYSYRTSDLKIGDLVTMELRLNFDEYPGCDAICICGRPGGRVPPAPGELEREEEEKLKPKRLPWGREREFWHDRINTFQDWREKGDPLPAHLHPGNTWPQLAPPPRPVEPK